MNLNKIYFLLFLLSTFTSAEPLDISSIRFDLREAVISRVQVTAGVTEERFFIDSSRLINSDRLKAKFAPGLFSLNSEKLKDDTVLSDFLNNYLIQNEKSLGSFFKKSSTIIKVFKKTEIHMFVAHEALNSQLEIEAGDVVVMQDLGDII
ncbi:MULTISPECIES: hypothetical protein [unclassified Lentimonas]|uniref:hypothetical protein n=1 Tax=unclassified Lentimonas TaxID=2630993 RepID=UPI001326B691|nr:MULTISPECIES: hypothetical protein [unclassified Lentimonas]CAA6676444.1 Unannotated [Lentimonas sp. CC4]CAA6685283.1 Unannotated [Lentimonas sp. CC6]CAA7074992.1 Unannotated [Lentimonas sp. CC4]CAA7171038.1 Unannotated [Lentimonas sp. CC21]CAA7180634.1 Unannotated [Lentimonas sp. CC8]